MTIRVADFAAASDVGRIRRANEDAYFVRSPLFVVADGMGGAQAGEVASKIASEAFAGGLDQSLPPERRMAEVVSAANNEIHAKSTADRDLHGMGTTLTAALLGDDEITIAHVGDSRAYRLRAGELTRLTRDHSLVGEMVRRGAISEQEAETHPQRSILTRALGPEPDVEVDTLSHQVRDGDIYLICSDGLTGMVDEATIARVAGSSGSMKAVTDELIRLANANGGVDNITVVAFSVTGGAPARATGTEEPGEQLPARPAATAAGGVNGTARAASDASSAAAAAQRRAQTRRPRVIAGAIFAALVLAIATGGALVGSKNVFFLGTDEHGLVTIYRGLPYDVPLASFYTKEYVSTVPAAELPQPIREAVLDHKLRNRADAESLMTEIERGNLGAATEQ